MDLNVEPGRYVVAVSGGVDSIALLHMLKQQPEVKLTVAHFDHGIREESYKDRLFVKQVSTNYQLPFIYDEGNLGANASEADARHARYTFLQKTAEASGADGIITAHHQDDIIETAIINLIRGTGRKGLSSLGSNRRITRPILHVSKSELMNYAKDQGLVWREDESNSDDNYLRNYIRHRLVTRFDSGSRKKMVEIVEKIRLANNELDLLLEKEISQHSKDGSLDRHWFASLSHNESCEVMASWLRLKGVRDFDKKTIERLVVSAKVGRNGKQYDACQQAKMQINSDNLALVGHER